MPLLILLFSFFCLFSQNAHAIPVPQEDQDRIATSLRKSLSVMPNWQIRLTEVNPSSFTGLYQGSVEFKSGEYVRYQNIFLSSDFKKYIIGNPFDSEEDTDLTRMKKMNFQGAPSQGPASAPVTIVEYSDFQCPSCKNAHERIKSDKLLEWYPGQVRLVYKNKPISQAHDWAMPAAIACRCAFKQKPDAFWSMADKIYQNQSSITAVNLWDNVSAHAKSVKLDFPAFKKCFDGKETLSAVNSDIAEADSLGVVQTPTFFINGRGVVGYQDPQPFRLLIEEFLKKK